jgi:hypothetical protein
VSEEKEGHAAKLAQLEEQLEAREAELQVWCSVILRCGLFLSIFAAAYNAVGGMLFKVWRGTYL